MNRSLSERYIQALGQLPQFMPHQTREGHSPYLIHVLTGVRVSSLIDPADEESEMLLLEFPGAAPFEVVGGLYFNLQVSEAAAHYHHAPDEGTGKIAEEASRLHEHLSRKHELS